MTQIQLRKWQSEAFDFFIKNNNCIIQAATGVGKTFFAIYVIKQLLIQKPLMKFLIVAPKNVILEQAWMSDMYKFGIPISDIGLYNGFTHEFSKITLVSIQSMSHLIEDDIYSMFDCVIFDEVHNYGTNRYLEILKINKPYKIGLSATLEREDMKHILIKKYFDDKIYNYDIQTALKDGVLNPFEFYHISISMDDETKDEYEKISQKLKYLQLKIGTSDLEQIKKHKEASVYLSLYQKRRQLVENYTKKSAAVKVVIKQNINKKILVFNQRNITSRNLYYELLEEGILCDIMNSELPDSLQVDIFNKFESDKLNILLATTMLDEGYNLPKIEVAILMAQNSTQKQFIQRMGRVLRKKETPSKVYYLTIKDTFEEKYFLDKKDLIKEIALKYKEMDI